jgi:hypothetical protein
LASGPASAEVLPDRPCPVADGGLQDRREGVGVGGVDLAAEGDPMPAETAVLGWLAARVAAWLRSTPQAEAPA